MSGPYDDLKRAAQAALDESAGDVDDWFDEQVLEHFLLVPETKARGLFIELASPATILELIAKAEGK